tara:strand:+ start:104 stop:673 length:570 start_codon:yes stop_codon:yes gene_type:complete
MKKETWLKSAVADITGYFGKFGYKIPPVNVTIGWTSYGKRSNAVGECWPRKAASDKRNVIFVNPNHGDSENILSTLIHELVHAVDDCKHAHGKEFRKIATDIGLEGKMRSTVPGAALSAYIERLIKKIGPYPGSLLTVVSEARAVRQTPKAKCPSCSYRASVPREMVEYGPPLCPIHGEKMEQRGDWKP